MPYSKVVAGAVLLTVMAMGAHAQTVTKVLGAVGK
jgi:hypothetical protein